ncbi:hypothetical protein J8273_0790 [Carpediemonas membranifera]|uniref:Uncharacterized protein n=1 Tax=Carpediemonas membranifera TaxID=201153 RepID=A0A8J6EBL5_9EUKA|nr:hypothetical protein J8273_0790 [Carpediemonas membranifera]|eukprot:KAG9397660.1 hypothetical protein J8273_0790 [Carpediemonas membranifera]
MRSTLFIFLLISLLSTVLCYTDDSSADSSGENDPVSIGLIFGIYGYLIALIVVLLICFSPCILFEAIISLIPCINLIYECISCLLCPCITILCIPYFICTLIVACPIAAVVGGICFFVGAILAGTNTNDDQTLMSALNL